MTDIDFSARIARARQEMQNRGVDALLVSLGSDLPYLTGYQAMPLERLTMAVIPAVGETVLVVPELEAPRVEPRPGVFTVKPWSETEDPITIVASLLTPGSNVMIGDQTWSVFLLALQSVAPETRFASARPLAQALRVIKDEAEIDRLRAAGGIADTVAGLLPELRFSGKTEAKVSAEVADLLKTHGNDTVEFAIVASGPNGASPHHEPGLRVIEPGDPVVLDFGGRHHGYNSDTTRMFHVGEPSSRYREVHSVVLAAQQAAFDAVRPGVTAESIDGAARSVIAAAGYGEYFIHRTGHGIGMDTHEDPYIVAGNTQELEPGMAFSIEPGIYLPGEFGVRIEDIVVCTNDGAERLNNSSHDVAIVD